MSVVSGHGNYDAHPMGDKWLVNCTDCGWGAFTGQPEMAHSDHLSDIARATEKRKANERPA